MWIDFNNGVLHELTTYTNIDIIRLNLSFLKCKPLLKRKLKKKLKEIKLKADEEYEIEKASIVRSETAAIDSTYEQKLKKASLAQQITKSTIGNKTRLRILSTKDEVLQDIFDDAEKN